MARSGSRGPQSIGLSDRQRRAITALLVAPSTPAAAREAGVSARTLRFCAEVVGGEHFHRICNCGHRWAEQASERTTQSVA